MLAGAWIAWDRQDPFLSELEVARVTDANPWTARATPGTALVFPVNDDDPAVTFLATRAANVIRAGLPPDRIRDVVVVVPAPEGDVPITRRELTRVTLADADAAIAERGGRHLDVILAPFDRVDLDEARTPGSPWTRVSSGVFLTGDVGGADPGAPVQPLEPSSPGGIVWATVATLALLAAAGYGWARVALADGVRGLALAPAFGMAAISLWAITLERLGVPLDGESTAGLLTSAVAGGSGYLMWLVLERRARARPTP
jgi:hypothetical protein